MTCLRCKNEIVYHAYGDRCAKPWGDFKRRQWIAPLCLNCYCALTAQKIFGINLNESEPAYHDQREYVGDLIMAIMDKTGLTPMGLGAALQIHPKVIGRWKLNKTKPVPSNADKLKAFAKERGIAA